MTEPTKKEPMKMKFTVKEGSRFAVHESEDGTILLILADESSGEYLQIKLEDQKLVEKLKSIGEPSQSGRLWNLV